MSQVPIIEAEPFFACQTLLGEGESSLLLASSERASHKEITGIKGADVMVQVLLGIQRPNCSTGSTLTMQRSIRELLWSLYCQLRDAS